MRYLHLSRREMYDIMGTELVVLRLKEQLYQNELMSNQGILYKTAKCSS